MTVVLETSLPGLPVRRGKVRDVYDLGDRVLLVSSDRLSAFDWVLPTGIPDKGRVLNEISNFWFGKTGHIIPNHLTGAPLSSVVNHAAFGVVPESAMPAIWPEPKRP